jgi:RIO-like serine/threonine protein kinase
MGDGNGTLWGRLEGMKFDASMMRFITRDEFRLLVSVEMGMKNHEIVPSVLVWYAASQWGDQFVRLTTVG